MLQYAERSESICCDPPSIFTTNSSESINAVVKRKVNFKETEWPQFNQELKQIVNEMHEESICALSGHGQYRLSKPYLHLQVDPSKWAKMTSEQRREHVSLLLFDLTPSITLIHVLSPILVEAVIKLLNH